MSAGYEELREFIALKLRVVMMKGEEAFFAGNKRAEIFYDVNRQVLEDIINFDNQTGRHAKEPL